MSEDDARVATSCEGIGTTGREEREGKSDKGAIGGAINERIRTHITVTAGSHSTATLLINKIVGTIIKRYVINIQGQSGPTYNTQKE